MNIKRWLIAVGVVALLLIAGLAWKAYSPAASLPEGLVPSAGQYDVEIVRDSLGVPHIFGRTDADATYGLAYAHAEDDFIGIQGALLAARGKLATWLGREGAANDYMVALMNIEKVVDEGYPLLPEDVRTLCQGYADGLNHYAARHPDQAISHLYPVSGRDVVAGFVHKVPLFFGLDDTLKGILNGDLTARRSGTIQQAQAGSTRDLTPNLNRHLNRPFAFDRMAGYEQIHGSNAMALAPSKTDDGSTVLVINSHQPWEGPVAWYEAHVHSQQGWNAAGGLFPGAPLILVGHNPHLGWAHTVNEPDLIDVFELRMTSDPEPSYLVDGEPYPLERETVEIEVKLWGPFHWTFRRLVLRSIHGPALRTPQGVFAVRTSGYGDVRHVEQWYRMNRAETLDQWQQAMELLAVPMFNTVYADAQGRIGYVYNGRLPQRVESLDGQALDWSGAVPGDRSELIWSQEEPLPYSRLPQVWDPKTGFVQNCNNTPFQTTTQADPDHENPDSTLFSPSFGIETHMTNRGLRALELLSHDPVVTWQEVLAYKYDTTYHPDSTFARRLKRALELEGNGSEDDGLLKEAQQVLAGFDLETDLEDRQASLAVMALGPRLSRALDDEALRRRLLRSARQLKDTYGTLEVPWGEVNRLRRGEVDLPLAGAPDVLHAIYARPEEDGRLKATAGDSYIMIARWPGSGAVESHSRHQFGSATRDESSRHFDDQTQAFASRELRPLPLSREAIVDGRAYRPGQEP